MQLLKYLLAIAALTAIVVTANAATITYIGDISKNGTGIGGANSNNAENNFFRLQTYLSDHPEFDICTPISEGTVRHENLTENGNTTFDVTGFSYAVVHYGKGPKGTGDGGGVAFFQISGDGFATFPAKGNGPNGKGGISSLDLFKCEDHNNVPDTGATAMLLGGALTGLGLARRYLKR